MSSKTVSKSNKGSFQASFTLYLRAVMTTFGRHRIMDNAAALTYTTLFAVVPMMTVTFSILSAIPSFQEVGESVQNYVFSNFVPATGEQVQSYLASFSQQARKLTAIGVGFLVVTAFMMLKTIDRAINHIWQVDRVRRGVSGFLLYWAILSLGPFMIGGGFVLTSYLASIKLVSDTTAYLGVDQWLLRLMPVVLSTLVFSLLYSAVPNRKVPFRHALVGAFVTACLIELAKAGFALFITFSPSYQLIYGAFAAVPLFLLWVYLSWILVLFGAVLVRSFALTHQMGKEALPDLLGVLVVLHAFRRRFRDGKPLKLSHLHDDGWHFSMEDWERYTGVLQDKALITKNDRAELVLAKDLGQIRLYDFCESLNWPLPTVQQLEGITLHERPEWFKSLIVRLQALNEIQSDKLQSNIELLFLDESDSRLLLESTP